MNKATNYTIPPPYTIPPSQPPTSPLPSFKKHIFGSRVYKIDLHHHHDVTRTKFGPQYFLSDVLYHLKFQGQLYQEVGFSKLVYDVTSTKFGPWNFSPTDVCTSIPSFKVKLR